MSRPYDLRRAGEDSMTLRPAAALPAALAGALALGLLTPLPVATGADLTAQASTHRVAGSGDPYFPSYGNRGYDVQHYTIRDSYDLRSGRLRGQTVIDAVATSGRTRVAFDLVLRPVAVKVNGAPARFRHVKGRKVVATLPSPAQAGDKLRVSVRYRGVPETTDRGKLYSPWLSGPREVAAVGEPEICAWWFACNDRPADKATYDIAVQVPRGNKVISNGVLVSRERTAKNTTWRWRMNDPMAAYLAFFVAGKFDVVNTRANGLPAVYAVSRQFDKRDRQRQMAMLKRTPGVVSWLAGQYGPYPFDALGGVVISLFSGFALENQSRPVYYPYLLGPGDFSVVVHELAHQWFGDSVSVRTWRDIWLNEGFATYSEWLYRAEHGGRSVDEQLRRAYDAHPAGASFWKVRIGDPGAKKLFSDPVYDRGAMAVAALSKRIGPATLTALLRTWVAQHRYGNADIAQFIALAEQTSGQDLTAFFRAWLYTGAKPARTAANGLA